MIVIRTICSWCGVVIHDGALIDGRVSHGICESCLALAEEEVSR